MIRIATVGEIGSGKSYVAKLLGFPVFNADIEINKIYKNNYKCFLLLKKKIPKFIKSYPIQKREILKAIFDNKNNSIKSNNKATIQDLENNNIYLENFEYSTENNFFKSTGKIKVVDIGFSRLIGVIPGN